MQQSVYLIDGNYQVARAVYKAVNHENADADEMPVVYLFCRMLWEFAKTKALVVVVFDGGRSRYRLDLLPEYKAQRDVKDKDLAARSIRNRAIDKLKAILPLLTIPVVRLDNEEGDDVIFVLAKLLRDRQHAVIVASDDSDYKQMLMLGVKVFMPMAGKIVDYAAFEKSDGYTPDYFCLFKAMVGDTSDNIKGVMGIGPVKAKAIVIALTAPTVEAVVVWCGTGETKIQKTVRSQIPILERNLRLIDLRYCPLSPAYVAQEFRSSLSAARGDVGFVAQFFRGKDRFIATAWEHYVRLRQAI